MNILSLEDKPSLDQGGCFLCHGLKVNLNTALNSILFVLGPINALYEGSPKPEFLYILVS